MDGRDAHRHAPDDQGPDAASRVGADTSPADPYYVRLPRSRTVGGTTTAAPRSWTLLLSGLALIIAVGAGVLAWVDTPTATPQSPAAPVASASATATAAQAASRQDGYAVWATNDDGSPVRWNPCEPIRWVLDPRHAPPQARDDLETAMDRITAATGLDFRFEGVVDEVPSRSRSPYQPDRYGAERWSPVLVSWVPAAATDVALSDNDRAVAIPVAVGDAVSDVFVSGQMVLNADKALPGGFEDRHASWGATILHELGHLVGLDHVDDPRQLMFTYPGFGPVSFGSGDRAGLEAVGVGAGCVEVPRPRAVEVTYQEDFGH